MNIIVGLGNPGKEYQYTRHNFGFLAVDGLAKELDLDWKFQKKFNSLIAKGQDFFLIKPLTFMNRSGEAVEAFLSYYKLLPRKFGLIKKNNSDLSAFLTVVHDDLDIEFGKYKISVNSRSAGHKGVQSIIDCLGTKNFKRVRFGIKPTSVSRLPIEKYVLSRFDHKEKQVVNRVIKEWITHYLLAK